MPSTPAPAIIPADVQPAGRRLARLEDELTTLTGHINAATARFLCVLAEFDRLEGWKPHGLVSTAHWLHWRCGFGLNAAREKVRVARALADLPQIRECFETGALSYSKVRAMTRIATPVNEHVLLKVARHGTTRHVETLVSKWRGTERSREVQRAGRQHSVRSLCWHYDEDGCLVIRATLPPEQGALVIEALEAVLDRLEEAGDDLTEGDEGDDFTEETEVEPAPAHAIDQAVHEAADETAHDPVCAAARDEGKDVSAETSEVVLYFPNQNPGPNPNPNPNPNPCLNPSSDSTPNLSPTMRLNSGSIPHLDPDPGLESDQNPTLSQRRADALVFLSESWLAGDRGRPGSSDSYLVNVHIDSATLAHAVAGRSELAEGPGLAAETVRRLCCDGGLVTHLTDAVGGTIDVGRKTRAIPPAIRRALRHRDRCCRFPGCTRSRWLDGHHVVHWADGGETSLDNLVLLCRHHHRLVHEGGFVAHAEASGRIRFTTPAGAVIPDAPTGRALELPLDQTLETFQLKRGLAIDAHTADCRWQGERMDYDCAGWLLMQAALKEEAAGSQSEGNQPAG